MNKSWGVCNDCKTGFEHYDSYAAHDCEIISKSVKHDEGKPDLTMFTWEMLEQVARVRMFGAGKYGRGNFKKTGFKYTRSLAAALRHLFKFLGGEDNDQESGLSHLAH